MKINAYVIYDSKARIYNKPFYFLNDQVALRAASDICSDQNSDVANHPEDFSMFKIGTYDDETAMLLQLSTPEIVVRFHEIAGQSPDNLATPDITALKEA